MTYETFTATMATIRHAIAYLKTQRGTGDMKVAIARNQAISKLQDAAFQVTGDYAKEIVGR